MTRDELMIAAKAFIVEHYSKITIGDALQFMADVKREHIPYVISIWREHGGLNATFLLEIATRLINEHKEP